MLLHPHLIMLPLLLAAQSVSPAPAPDRGCQSRITEFVREHATEQRRIVLSFVGTQEALQPLWEASSTPRVETAFFPIDSSLFVLTIQLRVAGPNPRAADSFAKVLCDLVPPRGVRYNGAIAMAGNDIVGADMSSLPAK